MRQSRDLIPRRLALLLLFIAGAAAAEPPVRARVDSILPSIGRPSGGQLVTLTGRNFKGPVRVFFDVGVDLSAGRKEAFVVSLTGTRIELITPNIAIPAGSQQLQARLVLINASGSPSEDFVDGGTFLFRNEVLTPSVVVAVPSVCSLVGGTRVTIIGDGFQAPVQVFFGDSEAQVISVFFNQVVVIAPPQRGAGPVAIRVTNVLSNTSFTLPDAIRYRSGMSIDAIDPLSGPDTGGTRLTIFGSGFNAPVAVLIGDQAAQVIQVSGDRIVTSSPPAKTTECQALSAPVRVFDIDSGEEATGPSFTYTPHKPTIVSIEPTITSSSGTVKVTLAGDAQEPAAFSIDGRPVIPRSVLYGTGATSYLLEIPPPTFPQGPLW